MYIKRTHYLNQLMQLQWVPLIKVLVWVRRVWKSVILSQYADELGGDQCLIINKEDSLFDHIMTGQDLERYVDDNIDLCRYLFIDEIQQIRDWDKAILSIFTRYKDEITIVITWSNSGLLSHEIGTILRGRTIDIIVYPLSFQEYCSYMWSSGTVQSFADYLQQWWLISSYPLPQPMRAERTNNLINTVFLQDIVERRSIKDSWLLRSLYDYLVDNVGNLVSIPQLIQTMKSKSISTNYNTLSTYIDHLSQALLIHQVSLYDIKGKKIFDKFSKIYSFDHNTKYTRSSGYDIGYGKYLENYVYLSLKQQGRNVYIGKIGDKEIDFIAEKWTNKIYIQVSYLLSSQEVVDREFGNLEMIDDSWSKYVITMDPILFNSGDGIMHIKAREREQVLTSIL